jgi:tRNA 2-thiouridine synthesizing protein A
MAEIVADIAYDVLIDVKDLQCPLPLLRVRQALGLMGPGQVLKVVATDNTTRLSFPSYLKKSGDELLKMEEYGKEIHHYIRKAV